MMRKMAESAVNAPSAESVLTLSILGVVDVLG